MREDLGQCRNDIGDLLSLSDRYDHPRGAWVPGEDADGLSPTVERAVDADENGGTGESACAESEAAVRSWCGRRRPAARAVD
jgi:hypothetical protein